MHRMVQVTLTKILSYTLFTNLLNIELKYKNWNSLIQYLEFVQMFLKGYLMTDDEVDVAYSRTMGTDNKDDELKTINLMCR